MKVLKWILFVAATAASVAGIVYAVMHRAECCCDCVNSLIEKVKSFVMPHVERFFTEEDLLEKDGEVEIEL
ncbi:MAG: hypothetical protein ACI4QO_00790 [Clostridia bacterium]